MVIFALSGICYKPVSAFVWQPSCPAKLQEELLCVYNLLYGISPVVGVQAQEQWRNTKLKPKTGLGSVGRWISALQTATLLWFPCSCISLRETTSLMID